VSRTLALGFLLLAAVPAAFLTGAVPARADDTMTAAANAFYAATAKASAGGGIPDTAMRARLQTLLSPGLNRLLADAAAAEARFNAKNKNSPPLIEGDIFSSLFEGPTAVKVGVCRGDDKIAHCGATLTRQEKGQKPVTWVDTLSLVNEDGWKIDDVAYDANFAFGNTGTLSDMLKMTLREAP
jgi:hypothetical protein